MKTTKYCKLSGNEVYHFTMGAKQDFLKYYANTTNIMSNTHANYQKKKIKSSFSECCLAV